MTAVEWYSQQHLKLLIKLENKELSIGEYAVQHQEILHKAKEMEKQQIIDAFNEGQALNVRGKLIQGKEWFEQFKNK